ncbi:MULTISPECIES: hypothetical protein [unclassified Pseudomonas]|uniref:hypothetical protein n=1 Tax=unclassified Pseudomonas TaxID=196821 RepID=UPI0008397475|nr:MULTISPECIES: hypothetical protein [unclassified Pseudomonas]
MSPHILIDQAIDGISDSSNPNESSVLVQDLITRLFTNDAITADEFNHYCKRLMNAQGARRNNEFDDPGVHS